MKQISRYLLENLLSELKGSIKSDKFPFKTGCLKENINAFFNADICCDDFYTVANGQGKEKDKMDTIYSSSLQSLLIMHRVSKDHPIIIGTESYSKALYEYRNRVIGYPSSVDVVLVNEDEKSVLFIESKLYEIIRDSTPNGEAVVGPSYFSSENGFHKLGLSCEELSDEIKIECNSYVKNHYNSGIKRSELSGNVELAKINPLKEKGFVYSEGIRQILSHIIGILNYKNPTADCSKELKGCQFKKVRFVEIYNMLPGFKEENAQSKLEQFQNHISKVKVVLDRHVDKYRSKLNADCFEILPAMTYQELFLQNSTGDNPYFDESLEIIRDFYHLNEQPLES